MLTDCMYYIIIYYNILQYIILQYSIDVIIREKYNKYKKMYLQLKYGQKAGEVTKNNDDHDWLNKRFKFSTTNQEYTDIITKLKDYCNDKIVEINTARIRDKIKNVYNNLGTKRLSELNINNIFEDENVLSQIDWREYHKDLCSALTNKIIPELEKQWDLQQKFIEKFKNMNTKNVKIDIGKYIEYAKHNDMYNKSVDDIVNSYLQKSEHLANYWSNEKQQTDSLVSYLKTGLDKYHLSR